MCAATVGWRNLRVAGQFVGGSGGVVGQKEHSSCELVSNVRAGGCMSTRAIPRSSVAKAPVDKRVANILATPGKIQTAPPNRFKSLVRHGILPCVVFMD